MTLRALANRSVRERQVTRIYDALRPLRSESKQQQAECHR
jgi:hypothetical protein